MSEDGKPRRPRAFQLGDSRLSAPPPLPAQAEDAAEADGVAVAAGGAPLSRKRRGWRWGALFLSAISGLVSLAIGLWVWDFVGRLFAREDWLGWAALALALIAGFAALMILMREIVGFIRLARVAAIRTEADAALLNADKRLASSASAGIERLFATREELAWNRRRLDEHRRDVLDARELLTLTEREMLRPLDRQARALIAVSVRRVAMVTAVSPSAILDVGFVALENLAMLRRLATLFGGRPGFLGSLRLARLVLGHLAVTGGVALGEDVVQQLIGHGLTARLSARLGEGVMNGAFTGRIGIAAIDLCRPLPFIEAERPKLRDFISELRAARRQAAPAQSPPATKSSGE
jgi:putative membrane protein